MPRIFLFALVAVLASLSACSKSPQSYVDTGNKFFEEGNYAEASLSYRKALQQDPKFGEAVYRLGLSELRAGNVLPAYESLRQAAEMLPDRVDVQVSYADLALSAFLLDRTRPQQFYDTVQRIAANLLAKDENSVDGLRLRGSLLMADRKPEEAVRDFEKARQLNPKQDQVALGLAQALYQAGRKSESESLAREHIGTTKYAPLYDMLYRHLMADGRTADAEKVLEDYIASAPKQSGPVLFLARHYAQAGDQGKMTATLQRLLGNSTDFPEAHSEVGDFYGSIGRPEEALREYEAGLAGPSKDKLLYRKKMVNLLIGLNRNEQAAPIVEAILKEKPDDEEALSVRASQWLNSGKPEDLERALPAFQSLVKRSPSNPVFRFSLGRAYMAKGDLQAARPEFVEAVRQRPTYMLPRFALTELALRSNQPLEAIRLADELLRISPGQPRARLLRASGLANSGNTTEARAELRSLVQQFPQYREAHLQLAMVALAEKKYQEAESIIRQQEQLGGGNDPRLAAVLAESYSTRERAEEGLRVLEEGLKKSPESLLLRRQVAITAARAGKYDTAIEQYQAILSRNPNELSAHVGLGEVYGLKGDQEKAIASLRKAQELAPRQVDVPLLIAVQLERSGQAEAAKEAYRQALKLQPDNLVALNNLAFLLAETGGDLEEAQRLAQLAVSKAPTGDPVPTDTLGWVYLKKGMADSARQVFANLVRTHPNDANYRYHLGAALLQQGDKAGARSELTAAIQNRPSADVQRKVSELLSTLN